MEAPNVNLLEDERFSQFCSAIISSIGKSRYGKKNLLRTPFETLMDERKLKTDWLRNEYKLIEAKKSTEPRMIRDYIKLLVESAMYDLAKWKQQQTDKEKLHKIAESCVKQEFEDVSIKKVRKPRQKKI